MKIKPAGKLVIIVIAVLIIGALGYKFIPATDDKVDLPKAVSAPLAEAPRDASTPETAPAAKQTVVPPEKPVDAGLNKLLNSTK